MVFKFSTGLDLLQQSRGATFSATTALDTVKTYLLLRQLAGSLGDVYVGLLAHHVAESAPYTLQHTNNQSSATPYNTHTTNRQPHPATHTIISHTLQHIHNGSANHQAGHLHFFIHLCPSLAFNQVSAASSNKEELVKVTATMIIVYCHILADLMAT